MPLTDIKVRNTRSSREKQLGKCRQKEQAGRVLIRVSKKCSICARAAIRKMNLTY